MSENKSNNMDDSKKSEELVEVAEEKVSMPDGLIKVSNRCKSCKNIFLLSSILYHITLVFPRDKKKFLSRCPVVPGQGHEQMSRDKLLCPVPSRDKITCPKEHKNRKRTFQNRKRRSKTGKRCSKTGKRRSKTGKSCSKTEKDVPKQEKMF